MSHTMDYFMGYPVIGRQIKSTTDRREKYLFETWANLPTTVYPFQQTFDKQAVSEVNANLF